MMELQNDTEALDADLLRLHKALFQHRSWLTLQRLAKVDLDRASAALLKAVASGGAACSRPQDIAQYLGIEAPSITRKVQQLEASGLLGRKPDPKDGRAYHLSITKKGKTQLGKLQAARQAQLQQTLANWDHEERQEFTRLLHKFNDALQNIIENKEKEKH